jgi:hypothetical protein
MRTCPSSDALHAVLFDSGRPVLIARRGRRDHRHADLLRLERLGRIGCRHRLRHALAPPRRCAAHPLRGRIPAARAEGGGILAYLHWHEIEAEAFSSGR